MSPVALGLVVAGVVLFLLGAGVAALFLFGLYVIHHVRVLRQMHASYHTQITDLKKKCAALETAASNTNRDLWGLQADLFGFRRVVTTALAEHVQVSSSITSNEVADMLARVGSTGQIAESETPDTGAWTRLLDTDEP